MWFFPPCCPVQVLSCTLFASCIFIWTNKDDDDDDDCCALIIVWFQTRQTISCHIGTSSTIFESNRKLLSKTDVSGQESDHSMQSLSAVRIDSSLRTNESKPRDQTRVPRCPDIQQALSASTACYHIAWALSTLAFLLIDTMLLPGRLGWRCHANQAPASSTDAERQTRRCLITSFNNKTSS